MGVALTEADDIPSLMIEEHMGMVIVIAKSYNPRTDEELDELIQLGRIGAWKAVQKFDSSKSKLSTYVWNYIRWEIGRHFATLKKKNSRAKVYYATPELLNSLAYTRDEGDLWEIIPDSLNEQEKIVVYMKANGNTLSEISEKIERSINWTHIIFKKAVKKIQDAHEEKTNSTM